MRVYQFHHYGIEIIRVLQHDSFSVPETPEEHSYQKLTFQTLTPQIFTHTITHNTEVRLERKYS